MQIFDGLMTSWLRHTAMFTSLSYFVRNNNLLEPAVGHCTYGLSGNWLDLWRSVDDWSNPLVNFIFTKLIGTKQEKNKWSACSNISTVSTHNRGVNSAVS